MPVIYPIVPPEEINVNKRIIEKYQKYIDASKEKQANNTQLLGEKYEIISILTLHEKLIFTSGEQISRWNKTTIQHISIGHNTEYDFIIPSSKSIKTLTGINHTGPILGEAKSYRDNLGHFIKNAIGYCLNDPSLGGFCFITPNDDYSFFLHLIHQTISILAGKENAPAITGGDSWQKKSSPDRNGKPDGKDILEYFKNKYYPEDSSLTDQNRLEILQNVHASNKTGYIKTKFNEYKKKEVADYYQRYYNRKLTAQYFNEELSTKAGLVVACYKVNQIRDDELLKKIEALQKMNATH
ncbi:hypothetical protein [Chromobacterium haemolyticum]|uniref:hypothetical protein n=1 Tax=Chromobacterium haemolyticum TaxID=394935 RepID=UPI0011B2917A|nr:hypothetical protein [Chromobacterium haemolyticum]